VGIAASLLKAEEDTRLFGTAIALIEHRKETKRVAVSGVAVS
jgi:hypothetical protein